jgi:hypothetical protein
VGLGTCPAAVESRGKEEVEEDGKEMVAEAADWGEVFGLVGCCGD